MTRVDMTRCDGKSKSRTGIVLTEAAKARATARSIAIALGAGRAGDSVLRGDPGEGADRAGCGRYEQRLRPRSSERKEPCGATCWSPSAAAGCRAMVGRLLCRGAALFMVLPHHRLWRHHAGGARRAEARAQSAPYRPLRFQCSAAACRGSSSRSAAPSNCKLGEVATVHYKVINETARTITGQAGYNVTPTTVGAYFDKINCFCFTQQTMKPGETREMAVVFYVDPKLVKDCDQDPLNNITLSYTFYPVATRSGRWRGAGLPSRWRVGRGLI